MTTPLPELIAAVPSLNDPGRAFSFEARGEDRIIGRWEAEDYQITIHLDEESETYQYNERNGETQGTGHVRRPLIAFLEEHGWSQHERPEVKDSRWTGR